MTHPRDRKQPIKLHRKIAAAFGYELIKKRKLNDTLEQHLANLLDLLDVNCVIDVGANNGHFGKLLRRADFRGRIASFEPLPQAFEQLVEASRNDAHWTTFHCALGNEVGVRTINEYSSDAFSSFLDVNKYGGERFKWRVATSGRRDVEIRTLSSIWPEVIAGIDQPRVYLKLDTQGFDLEVVQGAENVMQHIVGLQSEIATKPIYEGMPNYLTALNLFDRLGFEITGLYEVTRCKQSLAVIEYDCVMRRRSGA